MRIVRLGDVCTFKDRKSIAKTILDETSSVSFAPMDQLTTGQKFFTPSETKPLSEVYSSYVFFRENDVIYAKITPCFENGKLAIAKGLKNGIGFGSSEFVPITCSDQILPEYVYYFLLGSSFILGGIPRMQGASGHRRVPDMYTQDLRLLLPSIEEQLRIVRKLDIAFKKIDQVAKLTELNLANSHMLLDSSTVKLLDTDSDTIALGSVCGFQNGFAFKSSLFKETGKPILRISNIQDDKISTKRVAYTDPADYKEDFERYLVHEGDLVIAMSGATTGKIAVSNSKISWLQNQRVGRFMPTDKLENRYLYYFLKTQISKNLEISKGAAQPNLSTEQIKNIQLPEISLESQRQIVSKLDHLKQGTIQLEKLYKLKLDQLNSLKQSMLSEVFSESAVK